jgi:hypothetical protein
VLSLAEVIPVPELRREFLSDLAEALKGQEVGPGLLHRKGATIRQAIMYRHGLRTIPDEWD